MAQIIKANLVESGEGKSLQEKEAEVLAIHAAEVAAAENTETAETQAQDTPVVETQAATEVELKDEEVLSFLGKKLNKSLTSFDELMASTSQPEALPADVETFLKYKKETGRGIEDFIKLSRDYTKMDGDALIREYLSATQDEYDSEDIAAIIKKDYEFDESIDDEDTIVSKKLAKKKTLKEAKNFFKTQQEAYKIPLEPSSVSVSDDDKKYLAEYKQYTEDAIKFDDLVTRKRQKFDQESKNVFSENFNGFEVKLGEKTLKYAPGERTELLSTQSNVQNFIKKFLDNDGFIKDAAGYHKALSMAMYGDKWLQFAYEQGQADRTTNVMSGIKNINMGERQVPQNISKSGITVKKVGDDSGNGLKITKATKVN